MGHSNLVTDMTTTELKQRIFDILGSKETDMQVYSAGVCFVIYLFICISTLEESINSFTLESTEGDAVGRFLEKFHTKHGLEYRSY